METTMTYFLSPLVDLQNPPPPPRSTPPATSLRKTKPGEAATKGLYIGGWAVS